MGQYLRVLYESSIRFHSPSSKAFLELSEDAEVALHWGSAPVAGEWQPIGRARWHGVSLLELYSKLGPKSHGSNIPRHPSTCLETNFRPTPLPSTTWQRAWCCLDRPETERWNQIFICVLLGTLPKPNTVRVHFA